MSEKVLKTPSSDPGAFFSRTACTATGILSLHMGIGYTVKQLVGKPGTRLEAQLNAAFKALPHIGAPGDYVIERAFVEK